MADRPFVKPRPISGFPEWLPQEKLVEERMLRIIRTQFERFGFAPMETPAIERKEVLTAKGIVDKEIYALSRLAAGKGEDPSTEMALHFDLTVPTARYVAQHLNSLTFPFRRYQIQKVWRGERPQAGRFREFYQCDIDIIGNGSIGLLADAEIPAVIHAIFSQLDVGPFIIRMNNRKLLQGILEHHGLEAAQFGAAMRIIDEFEKIGEERTVAALSTDLGIGPGKAQGMLNFLFGIEDEKGGLVRDNLMRDPDPRVREGESSRMMGFLQTGAGRTGSETLKTGYEELSDVRKSLKAFGVPDGAIVIDPSIARGLDYYTGTVYETQLLDHPAIGSVCSGGRYDDLASTYTKQRLPGVGISIGLTRMLSRLFDAGVVVPGPATPAAVLVTVMDPAGLPAYLAMAVELRDKKINTEVYTESKKLGAQLKYADAKGFVLALIAGDQELEKGEVQIKVLATGEQVLVPRADLVDAVTDRLKIGSAQSEPAEDAPAATRRWDR